MRAYPLNALFATVFVDNEARSQFSGRIRAHFDAVCTADAPPLVWLFAIQAESARQGSSLNRVRALFEKALEFAKCRQCVVLWRLYMTIELQAGTASAAKAVFYRAVRFAPFSKRLWTDCIRRLRPAMDAAELSDILKICTEKEIRIYTLL
eukprot:TRINITY_DN6492_c0_g1_i1.p2 TRINITY_DN6492_c0_g1~~TRINITY_DN6492_c0_g1_i1.p2  ORF type:complete len:151 (+),score=57.52 TRINITY_DN6492_c0_g1_i1:476-928(+)